MMPGKLTLIDVMDRNRDELLNIAERACAALVRVANYVTTDEGDEEDTSAEIIGMAHDNMIADARNVLGRIAKDYPPPETAEHISQSIRSLMETTTALRASEATAGREMGKGERT